ncbi:nuclear pore complex protein Nup50 [Nelusetta ayraudi]|uniref:nuclear pore complex protein Nup50 n=1 Tax=Nelusetta ayraudi TaxID=303726 RepID=UPI003F718E96
MAKRIADKELTDRNWDQEEDGEEAGTFSLASQDVLKNRAFKRARRRNVGGESEGGGSFKGFKGFSLSATGDGAAGGAAFSGFGSTASVKGFGGLINGNSSAPSLGSFTPTAPGLTFNGPVSVKASATTDDDGAAKQTNGSAPSTSPSRSGPSPAPGGGSREYSRQLAALNCCVRDWISKHVDRSPLCDLSPIFRDYERHLSSIERQYSAGGGDVGKTPITTTTTSFSSSSAPPPALFSFSKSSTEEKSSSSSSAPPPALFSFSKSSTEEKSSSSSSSSAPAGVTFNFGQKVDSAALTSPSTFSFSSSSASTSTTTSSGPTSLFGASAAPPSFSASQSEGSRPAAGGDEEEESDEPPKPEVKEVKEDDAFYSKKCKLFYKKESEFKEKGVGTLHLKLTEQKTTQMIVRADTSLGNILLNILVQDSMPVSRLGKNNVMVVCVPNPPLDSSQPDEPVPLLIRVKTAQDADELLSILKEKKG